MGGSKHLLSDKDVPLLEVFTPVVLFVHVFLLFLLVLKVPPTSPERISTLIQEEVTRQAWGPELNKGQTLGL